MKLLSVPVKLLDELVSDRFSKFLFFPIFVLVFFILIRNLDVAFVALNRTEYYYENQSFNSLLRCKDALLACIASVSARVRQESWDESQKKKIIIKNKE